MGKCFSIYIIQLFLFPLSQFLSLEGSQSNVQSNVYRAPGWLYVVGCPVLQTLVLCTQPNQKYDVSVLLLFHCFLN